MPWFTGPVKEKRARLTPPSSGRSKGRFAPFGSPLMSNVRPLALAKKSNAALSVHVGAVMHGMHVRRCRLSVRAAECQAVEGAPRRRAAPGNQLVKVAAGAATGCQSKRCASTRVASSARGGASQAHEHFRTSLPQVSHQPRPCAKAQRLRSSPATVGVGASAHARHASATHCHATTRRTLVASEHNGRVRGKSGAFIRQEPNPSIERTSSSKLRLLPASAHVER